MSLLTGLGTVQTEAEGQREKEGRRVGTMGEGGVLRYAGTAVPPRCES